MDGGTIFLSTQPVPLPWRDFMHSMSYETLMRIASGLAVAAVLCRFLPSEPGIAIAVSRNLHIGMTYSFLVPALLLMLAGAISAIALYINVRGLTLPLRM